MSATVCVPVTDLRREPVPAKRGYERDFLQETQLLYGEKVRVLEINDQWSRVEALQQPKFINGGGWQGYPGWINSSHICMVDYNPNYIIQSLWTAIYQQPDYSSAIICSLPFGAACISHLGRTSGWVEVSLVDGQCGYIAQEKPLSLLAKTGKFIGNPYLWGGCSPYNPRLADCTTSVDCSGLVHLVYRSIGLTVPRDAKDQRFFGQEVQCLEPGDAVFCADIRTPEKIDHAMLYVDGETLIEACLEAGGVRRISFEEKFGVSLGSVKNGDAPNHAVMFVRF